MFSFQKFVMSLRTVIASIACLLLLSCTPKLPPAEKIDRLVQSRLGPDSKITSVTRTDVSGLFEVVADGEIFYVDSSANYLVVGSLVRGKDLRNLTTQRSDEVNRIEFSALPLTSAVKEVVGDGSRTLVVFEDPNCRYCKKFRNTELGKIQNVTVYTFLYPLLSEDSAAKSRLIWCASDKKAALRDWSVNGALPDMAAEDCKDPGKSVAQLGKQLRIRGTPALFFLDGSRLMGAAPSRVVEEYLSRSSAAVKK